MAKKIKKQKPKKRPVITKQSAPRSKSRFNLPRLAFITAGTLALVLIGINFLYQKEDPAPPTPVVKELKKKATNLQENRPTLPPQRFTGTFRLAYEVAREIPEVLDKLYCYCRCQENLGHKNLLSCYVDTHAST